MNSFNPAHDFAFGHRLGMRFTKFSDKQSHKSSSSESIFLRFIAILMVSLLSQRAKMPGLNFGSGEAIIRKRGYPPAKPVRVTELVLEQAHLLYQDWAA
jgi:hypothetical protein